jgi:replication-associated recombination protein RarA
MQTIADIINETVKLELMRINAELEYEEELKSLRQQQENEVPLDRTLVVSIEDDISFYC